MWKSTEPMPIRVGNQQGKFSIPILHHGEERRGTVPNGHLNGKSLARFAVINGQRQSDAALCDGEVD